MPIFIDPTTDFSFKKLFGEEKSEGVLKLDFAENQSSTRRILSWKNPLSPSEKLRLQADFTEFVNTP